MPIRNAYLAALLVFAACSNSASAPDEETIPNDITDPLIVVDSPTRGTLTEDGRVTVSGHVSDEGSGVASVSVNGQDAELADDGSFTALVNLPEGITLLESVVTDKAGNRSDDLRAILNGQLADQGSNVKDALVGNVNRQTLGILSTMVSDVAESTDFGQVGKAFNPLVDVGNSCAGVKLNLNSANKSNVDMNLNPTPQGVQVEVVLHDLDVDMTANFKIGCFGGGGSAGVNISATSYTATGLLDVNITENGDLDVSLANLQTSFQGFDLDVGSIPSVIVNLFNSTAESKVKSIIGNEINKMVPSLGKDFLSDFTKADLAFNLLGDTLHLKLRPVDIAMSDEGIRLRVDGSAEFENVQGASYLTSPRPVPSMAGADQGLSIGLADDLANQLMASLWASSAIENLIAPQLAPQMRGLFGDTADDIRVDLMLPPIVSTDPVTGAVRLTIGDLIVRVADPSGVLVEFAVSAEVDLKIEQDAGILKLVTDAASVRGKLIEKSPQVVLNIDDATVAAIAELAIKQISNQSDGLFEALPIPSFGAIMVGLPQVHAADGYLLLDAELSY